MDIEQQVEQQIARFAEVDIAITILILLILLHILRTQTIQ